MAQLNSIASGFPEGSPEAVFLFSVTKKIRYFNRWIDNFSFMCYNIYILISNTVE